MPFAQVPHWVAPKPHKPKRPKPARPRPPVHQQVANPFAPRSDAELQAQAGSLVQGQLGPIIAAIRAAIEGRSQSGQAAIQGLTQSLGGLFQGAAAQTGAAYNQARGAGEATNAALANRLGSFGQGQQTEIGNKLAYAGPSGANIAAGAGTAAQGTANAGFAKGAAGTEMLNTQGAAAQAASAALPGIAGLTGLQNSRNLQAQLSSELNTQLGQAQTNASSSISSIYQHLVDQELQKAIANQSGLINKDKLAADTRYKNQTLAYKQKVAKFNQQTKLASLGISQQRVSEYARHNGISESQAANRLAQQAQKNKQTQKNQNLRQSKWAVNPDGSFKYRKNKKTGKRERIPLPGKKSGSSSDGL